MYGPGRTTTTRRPLLSGKILLHLRQGAEVPAVAGKVEVH